MKKYAFGLVFLLALIGFGIFYVSSDFGGNSHFDQAGENWKRK